ncbi:class I SAM-dependent methyltransferase [Akkermansiaceae bacterium]|jgi:predicted O-methyltransferase YrrM|nr:class I SAM-dependent methyltransferase [Akkermansiaceae bacterium]MDB4464781.1 class I SAM-dependent methyltransferase [Akkermansiaceae bacterium]MDB4488569.1 class I SAM-dependent methyltransferase [Akkermansiaceae bacterium]MDB4509457.1 class I SAM-dependent methyltransferase [Akkermansiaceae bacterium]MDB4566570.1 class I SAM-dependent methyltransferase [Akkermansiaceae bacterium]
MKRPSSVPSFATIAVGRFLSRIYRKQDAAHQNRLQEIEELAEPLENALEFFPDESEAGLEEWERSFREVKEQLAEEVDFHATADMSLTWLQYLLTRATRPKVVLETGVWIGGSSFTLLSALTANKCGKLVSIDFPPFKKKNRVGIGRLVPESLYERWELHLGPSKALLPKVAGKGEVDIFIHDSDHTYANMTAEFEKAWDLVKPGGFVVSDDSSMNDSVLDFVEKKKCRYKFLKREKGGTIAILVR